MGDKVTAVERLLNRAQQELGGQVGSFRLKGARYRFAGRSSVVAFAEGMWGGDYALKFYCDPAAAEREFNIYRQATVRAHRRLCNRAWTVRLNLRSHARCSTRSRTRVAHAHLAADWREDAPPRRHGGVCTSKGPPDAARACRSWT